MPLTPARKLLYLPDDVRKHTSCFFRLHRYVDNSDARKRPPRFLHEIGIRESGLKAERVDGIPWSKLSSGPLLTNRIARLYKQDLVDSMCAGRVRYRDLRRREKKKRVRPVTSCEIV